MGCLVFLCCPELRRGPDQANKDQKHSERRDHAKRRGLRQLRKHSRRQAQKEGDCAHPDDRNAQAYAVSLGRNVTAIAVRYHVGLALQLPIPIQLDDLMEKLDVWLRHEFHNRDLLRIFSRGVYHAASECWFTISVSISTYRGAS